jgi:hypothetical protein
VVLLAVFTSMGETVMKNFRGFLNVSLVAVAALLLLTAASKGQYQIQTFSRPSSFGRTFTYRPYQVPFRMPPGFNFAYVNPSGGLYNYAPRVYYPGWYSSSSFYSFTTPYPPLYVPNVNPFGASAVPTTPAPIAPVPGTAPSTPGPVSVY